MSALLKWIDMDNIPEYLGGKSKGTLVDDLGPWKDPKLLAQLEMENTEQGAEEPEKIIYGSDFEEEDLEESSAIKGNVINEEQMYLSDPPKAVSNPLLPTPEISSPTPSSPSAMSRTKALTGR